MAGVPQWVRFTGARSRAAAVKACSVRGTFLKVGKDVGKGTSLQSGAIIGWKVRIPRNLNVEEDRNDVAQQESLTFM